MIKYKSVTLRCYPIIDETLEILDGAFIQVRDFMNTSLRKFGNDLYNIHKEKEHLLPMGTIASLAQRFSFTVLKNEVIPLDKYTYKVINRDGWYAIEAKILGNQRVKDYDKVVIPISRSDNEYYGDIIEKSAYGAFLHRQSNEIFLTVSIPIEMKCKRELPAVFIGIDLNMKKDAVSLYNPKTDNFEHNFFFDRTSASKTFDRFQRRLSRITKGLRARDWTDEIKKEVGELYRRRSAVITTSHGNFISQLIELADSYIDEQNVVFVLEDLKNITKKIKRDKTFNTWLNAKWCYGRFRELLETKGYPVIDVYPFHTSKKCHICGNNGEYYGNRDRLFKCENCNLVNFNRDLNAARNIALRGYKYLSKQKPRLK